MKRQKWLKTISCTLFAVPAMLFLSQPLSAKTYRAQVSSQMPVKHPITMVMEHYVKTVNKKSNGRLKLAHFSSGQLLNDREVPNAINKGTVQMAQTFFVWWSGKVRDVFPYGGKQPLTQDHVLRLMNGPVEKHINAALDRTNAAGKTNVKVIAPILYSINAGYILKKPVKNFGDMKGMKIRIPSRLNAAEVASLGGVPTVMSSADVYMSLQRNTIQGALSGLPSFYARKWYEGAKHILFLKPIPTNFHIVANLTWFNSLPKDLQEILMEVGKEVSAMSIKLTIGMESKIESMLAAKGAEIFKISPEEYKRSWAPTIEPALKKAAVKLVGQKIADNWDRWVEETK